MGQAAQGHLRAHRGRHAHREEVRSSRIVTPGAPLTLMHSPQSASHPDSPEGEGLRAGIGLRAVHHEEILATSPRIGWFEAHSENYFARGGSQRRILAEIAHRYPLSLHGVGLSLGSADPIARSHLTELGRLVRETDPLFVSEH